MYAPPVSTEEEKVAVKKSPHLSVPLLQSGRWVVCEEIEITGKIWIRQDQVLAHSTAWPMPSLLVGVVHVKSLLNCRKVCRRCGDLQRGIVATQSHTLSPFAVPHA